MCGKGFVCERRREREIESEREIEDVAHLTQGSIYS